MFLTTLLAISVLSLIGTFVGWVYSELEEDDKDDEDLF